MSRTTCAAHIPALVVAGVLAAGAATATAAEGHHSVDAAVIVSPGECEQENWFSRARRRERLFHAGLNCRLGPVELGGAGEHVRTPDGSETAWSLEVKWAAEVLDGLSFGLSVQPGWQAHLRPRHSGSFVNAMATWSPRPDLAVHVNLGRDFVRRDKDVPSGGLGVDWTVKPGFTLTVERFLEERTHLARAGLRWQGGKWWSVDASRAQRLSGPAPSNWTIGVTFALDAD